MPNNSTVEERVVEMRIDNRKFESGANKTISTLEKLQRALKLKSDTQAVDDLQKSIDKVAYVIGAIFFVISVYAIVKGQVVMFLMSNGG